MVSFRTNDICTETHVVSQLMNDIDRLLVINAGAFIKTALKCAFVSSLSQKYKDLLSYENEIYQYF